MKQLSTYKQAASCPEAHEVYGAKDAVVVMVTRLIMYICIEMRIDAH